jgi:hypothetical protein
LQTLQIETLATGASLSPSMCIMFTAFSFDPPEMPAIGPKCGKQKNRMRPKAHRFLTETSAHMRTAPQLKRPGRLRGRVVDMQCVP